MNKFKRVIAIIAILAVFGGGSLGMGLGVGFAIGRHYIESITTVNEPPPIPIEEEPVAFLFADQETERLPIEVRVSDITSVVRKVSDSVVSINIVVPAGGGIFGPRYHPGSGSGIIFAEDEEFVYIATNNHVVERATTIYISLDDEYQVEAVMIDGDRLQDLAVLSVPRSALEGKQYKIAVFGDSDQMQVGDEVVAIGNPMGEGQTATRGIISAMNRQITVDGRTLNVLQTDAAINPGNSGGALANIRGEVIGINTAKAISFNIEGMGYAIPSNEALMILERLLEDATTPSPYLGVTLMNVDENHRRMHALPSVGTLVRAVEQHSPADHAGLQIGDLIVGFNDITIETMTDLAAAISNSDIGETIILHIYRRGIHPMSIAAVIGDANAR